MRRRLWIHLVAWAAVAAVTADVLADGALRHLDWRVHLWLTDHSHGVFRAVAFTLAQAGQRGAVVVPLGVVAAVLAWRCRTVRPLVLAGSVCLGLAIVVPAIKLGIGRTAPRDGVDLLFAYSRRAAEYPSGHAINGIVLWGLTMRFLAELGGRWAAVLTPIRQRVLAAVLGVAAGIGMLGLNYHWVTDVLAGWPMGLSFYLIVTAIPVTRRPSDTGLGDTGLGNTGLGNTNPGGTDRSPATELRAEREPDPSAPSV